MYASLGLCKSWSYLHALLSLSGYQWGADEWCLMSVLGESATIEQLLKMSWTFVNDRSDSQSTVAVGLCYLYYRHLLTHTEPFTCSRWHVSSDDCLEDKREDKLVILVCTSRSHTPMSAIYLHSGGYIIIGMHIGDTRTMCWEIYYVHLQYGRTLFVDLI